MENHFVIVNPLIPSMTLDELIQKKQQECFCQYDGAGHDFECTKKLVLAYAHSIIPNRIDEHLFYGPNPFLIGLEFNRCRTQILSRIEEDSK